MATLLVYLSTHTRNDDREMRKIRFVPALIGAACGLLAAVAQQEIPDQPPARDFPRAGIVRVARRSSDPPATSSSSWPAPPQGASHTYETRLEAVRERLRSPLVPEWFPPPPPPPRSQSVPPH